MADSTKEIAGLTEWQLYVGGFAILLLVGTLVLTVRATNAAVEANRIARESAERQLRAYVGFADISLEWDEQNRLVTKVRFINHGQTPAYKAQLFANMSVSQGRIDFDKLPPEPSETASDLALKGRLNASLTSSPLPPELVEAIKAGQSPIFVWGLLKYEDAFEKCRETHYRYQWHSGLNRLVATAEGNKSN